MFIIFLFIIFLIVFSIIIVVAGFGIIGYFYFANPNDDLSDKRKIVKLTLNEFIELYKEKNDCINLYSSFISYLNFNNHNHRAYFIILNFQDYLKYRWLFSTGYFKKIVKNKNNYYIDKEDFFKEIKR